jgi:hypothetical protein
MKYIYLLPLLLAACTSYTKRPAAITQDTTKVKAWIVSTVEDYSNNADLNVGAENLRKACTEDYYNYKQDAINLDYDTTMTPEGFDNKWKHKYNTKYVGNGGYIISAPDNGKVKVSNIYCIKDSLYKVVIKDVDFNMTYNRDFKIIEQNGQYKIDDILEYN